MEYWQKELHEMGLDELTHIKSNSFTTSLNAYRERKALMSLKTELAKLENLAVETESYLKSHMLSSVGVHSEAVSHISNIVHGIEFFNQIDDALLTEDLITIKNIHTTWLMAIWKKDPNATSFEEFCQIGDENLAKHWKKVLTLVGYQPKNKDEFKVHNKNMGKFWETYKDSILNYHSPTKN